MQRFKIIEHPHLLFVGANGHRTYGIKVEDITMTKKECEDQGYQFDFHINDFYFLARTKSQIMDELGLTDQEYDVIVKEFNRLINGEK